MRKQIEYKLLSRKTRELLEKAVNEYLADGWEAQGAMTFIYYQHMENDQLTSTWSFLQTLVKYEDSQADNYALLEYLEK
jgi:hypothetical protein